MLCHWFKNLYHQLNQSVAKRKPIATMPTHSHFSALEAAFTCTCVNFEFSLASCNISFVLIGHCDYFGFGFTTLNRKALHVTCFYAYVVVVIENQQAEELLVSFFVYQEMAVCKIHSEAAIDCRLRQATWNVTQLTVSKRLHCALVLQCCQTTRRVVFPHNQMPPAVGS